MTLETSEIARLLEPFGLDLDRRRVDMIGRYLDLLLRWNRAVNLTAIREPEEIVTRHFGESMYVTKFEELGGPLLDVGSGAGFPGLAIKIVRPEIPMVLLEPVAKKRAFLKEVARECGFQGVEVIGDRVEDYSAGHGGEFNSVTLRAVGDFESVLPAVARCLKATGSVYAWLTGTEASRLSADLAEFRLFAWSEPIKVPLSRDREIWIGRPTRRST
jgi:16S rRNA (guanine527-N7)-methyltransferase